MDSLVVIAGPTGSGKTDLAMDLAQKFNGEIISADSMQIYKYMDIGTAKTPVSERRNIIQHMLDIVSPFDQYSVAQYQADAQECIKDIINRGKTPILTGGTGLYINSILFNMDFYETKANEEYREEITRRIETEGIEALYRELCCVDSDAEAVIKPNDKKRIIRALEIYHFTGKGMAVSEDKSLFNNLKYNCAAFFLKWDRETLYERINKRVDLMIERGLINEVNKLADMGCTAPLQSMQAIGYKEVFQYKKGELTLEEAIDSIKRNTRRYAKRQETWFKRYDFFTRLDMSADTYEENLNKAISCINAKISLR